VRFVHLDLFKSVPVVLPADALHVAPLQFDELVVVLLLPLLVDDVVFGVESVLQVLDVVS
jgi:hypothetical protein